MNASVRPARPRVVVVGGGMAGLATVRALSRAPVTVQLIDAHNYTTFPPLLFQVATCFISPAEVARPIRGLLRRSPASFRKSTATASPSAAARRSRPRP
jgi:NADH dehydrogenase FAD-containing subunit